jgi:hypothetical protein
MGLITSIFEQTFVPQSKFNVEDIPDLTGKVIIVTGANTGLLQNHLLSCTLMLMGSTLFSIRNWKRNGEGKSSSMLTTNQVHDSDIVKRTGIASAQRESIHRCS